MKSRQISRERDTRLYDGYLIQVLDVVKAYETESGLFLALKNVKLAI